jgi:hypothetical protein
MWYTLKDFHLDQQLSMFTYFLKKLSIIKVDKKERKHEAREEVEKHLHISIFDPLEINF